MCKRYNNYVSCDHAWGGIWHSPTVNHERERERGAETSWSENFAKLSILFYVTPSLPLSFRVLHNLLHMYCIVHTRILNMTKETFCWSLRRPKREYTYIHMHTYVCMHVCMHARMYGWMYVWIRRAEQDGWRSNPSAKCAKLRRLFAYHTFFS